MKLFFTYKKSLIIMSAQTVTVTGKTYRFKFSKDFLENLKEFTYIHLMCSYGFQTKDISLKICKIKSNIYGRHTL